MKKPTLLIMYGIRKFRAYTLSELLVSIVIVILVVAFAQMSLQHLLRRSEQFTRQILWGLQITTTEKILWEDFHRSGEVYLDAKKELFYVYSPTTKVRYQYQEGRLLRNHQVVLDSGVSIDFYFKGRPVKEGRFDALHIQIFHSGIKTHHLFITVARSAALYTNCALLNFVYNSRSKAFKRVPAIALEKRNFSIFQFQ